MLLLKAKRLLNVINCTMEKIGVFLLTWNLDSLGGNSRTTMLATVSPCSAHIDETLATLRYASQARSIINTVRVNEAPQDKLIRELKAEIDRLKEIEAERSHSYLATPIADNQELEEVKTDLAKTKEELCYSKTLLEEANQKFSTAEDQIQVVEEEKISLRHKIEELETEKIQTETKLKEYLDNNRQLACKIESEKADKKLLVSAREEEFKNLSDDYNALYSEHERLKKKFEETSTESNSEKEQVESLKAVHNEKIQTLEEEIKNLELITESLQKQLKDAERNLDNEKKDKLIFISEKEAAYEVVKKQAESFHDDVKSKEVAYVKLEDKNKYLLDELNCLKTVCNKLRQESDNLLETIKEKDLLCKNLQKELTKVKKMVNNTEDVSGSLKEEVESIRMKLREKEETINEKARLYKNLKKELSKTNKMVDDKENIISTLKEEIRSLRKIIKESEESIKQKDLDNDNLKKEVSAAMEMVNDKQELSASMKEEIKSLHERLIEKEEEIRSLRKIIKESIKQKDLDNDNLKKEVSAAMEMVNDKQEFSASMKNEIKSLHERLKEKEETIKEKDADYNNLKKDLIKAKEMMEIKEDFSGNLREEIRSLRDQIKGKEETCNKFSRQLESLNEVVSHKEEAYANLKTDLKNLLEVVKDKDNMCENLKKEMKSLKEIAQDKTEAYTNLKENMSQLNSKCDSIQSSLETTQSAAKEFHEKYKLEEALEKLTWLQEENNNLNSQFKAAQAKFEMKCKESQQTNHQEMDRLQDEIVKLRSENQLAISQRSLTSDELTLTQNKLKVCLAENNELEKKLSNALVSYQTVQEQLKIYEKEKDCLLDKVNKVTGEKLVTDYKLRESLGRNQLIHDREEAMKSLQGKYDDLKDECAKLKKELSDVEHHLSISKMNEESLRGELSRKTAQVDGLQTQLKSAHRIQQELREEKLTIIKVMEKQCMDPESAQNYKALQSENATLKRDLNINSQRLEKKIKRIEALNEKVTKLEDFMKLILEQKISFETQKEILERALMKKDVDAYNFLMNISFPHHLEHLTRKARRFADLYRIPYDFEIGHENTVIIRHVMLSAKVRLQHGQFNDWVEKIEKHSTWKKDFDVNIPWEVDFGDYYEKENEVPETLLGMEDPVRADSALGLGTTKTSHGLLNPILWRRLLVKRHVQGIKEDSDVLMKYFPNSEDSRVYSILIRIQASVSRLEEITKGVVK